MIYFGNKDGLRRAAKANDMAKSRIAEATGVFRPTFDLRLEGGDMKPTEFLNLAAAVKKKPGDVMACAKAETLAERGE